LSDNSFAGAFLGPPGIEVDIGGEGGGRLPGFPCFGDNHAREPGGVENFEERLGHGGALKGGAMFI
jgi:hypothetical protein